MIVTLCPSLSGLVKYKVSFQGTATTAVKVTLIDKDGLCVDSSSEPSGVLKAVDVKLWWPYLMHKDPGYLYSLEVRQTCLHTCQSYFLHKVSDAGHMSIATRFVRVIRQLA